MSQKDKPAGGQKNDKVLYDLKPDYTRPLLELPVETENHLLGRLTFLYGRERAKQWLPELVRILKVHHAHKTPELSKREEALRGAEVFSQADMIIITYGDMIEMDGELPLRALTRIARRALKAPNTLHILPFFPYSSDRGFAVTDFERVDPRLGDWSDIRTLAGSYKLMFDGVLNHVSSHSRLFQDFLDGRSEAEHFFIDYDSPDALTPDQRSKIFRPRTSDILTPFDTINGKRYLWTTFSDDQIDLNYRDPRVLLAAVEALLLYVRMGADLLRLDAVTYVWAEPGTECVHLPETHEVVKLLRAVIDLAAPGTAIVTETNVPHRDNVSYFGNGDDEAHMIYNFALPPLTLYTFYAADSGPITEWARGLATPSDQTHFFNILDTHDGIGLLGAEGILDQEQIGLVLERAEDAGALISYKTTPGGGRKPYEINTTWWSAVNGADSTDDLRLQIKRYLASRSISLVLKGVPGIYVHGALGSANDPERVNRTGVKRDINRGIIYSDRVEEALHDPDSKLSLILYYGSKLNLTRNRNRAFHPRGEQTVLDISTDVFAVLRTTPEGDENVLAVTNVTKKEVRVEISLEELGIEEVSWQDLLSERLWEAQGKALRLILQPYDVAWLKPVKDVQGKGWL